jgi:hypothetical protein
MITKHSCEWDRSPNDRSNYLEEGSLAVKRVVVQLISSENHKVWLLDIQDLRNEVYGEGISVTLRQIVPISVNGIFAYSDTSAHMCVRDLDDLKLMILSDS